MGSTSVWPSTERGNGGGRTIYMLTVSLDSCLTHSLSLLLLLLTHSLLRLFSFLALILYFSFFLFVSLSPPLSLSFSHFQNLSKTILHVSELQIPKPCTPPSISVHPVDVASTEGGSIDFNVVVEGHPEPKVAFHKRGKRESLRSNERMQIGERVKKRSSIQYCLHN